MNNSKFLVIIMMKVADPEIVKGGGGSKSNEELPTLITHAHFFACS